MRMSFLLQFSRKIDRMRTYRQNKIISFIETIHTWSLCYVLCERSNIVIDGCPWLCQRIKINEHRWVTTVACKIDPVDWSLSSLFTDTCRDLSHSNLHIGNISIYFILGAQPTETPNGDNDLMAVARRKKKNIVIAPFR